MSNQPDKLVMENGKLTISTAEGKQFDATEDDFYHLVRDDVVPPIGDAALPDGVKFFKWQPPFLCVVHQLPAHVRQVRWITVDSPAPYGAGAKFAKREISLPYAITFAIYCLMESGLCLINRDELYFRNEPLKTRGDQLGYPALLNVSKIDDRRRVRSWICTQHLRTDSRMNWAQQLGRLIDHTWNGGFNLSSEHHEGASWYGESKGIHPDLHPIERWVKATKNDSFFACNVTWKPVGLNVGQIEDAMLEECGQHLGVSVRRRCKTRSTSILGRLINSLQKQSRSHS